jgi:septum formation protein
MKPDVFILGSRSTDRKDLMESAGFVPFVVIPSDYEEKDEASDPNRLAEIFARKKAEDVLEKVHREARKGTLVETLGLDPESPKACAVLITADTIVSMKSEIYGKAESLFEAYATLTKLQGQTHKLITAFCIKVLEIDISANRVTETDTRAGISVTKVKFLPLSDAKIKDYLESNEWKGRAGCYAIQGRASQFIRSIDGSPSGVIGLPIADIVLDLEAMDVHFSTPVDEEEEETGPEKEEEIEDDDSGDDGALDEDSSEERED